MSSIFSVSSRRTVAGLLVVLAPFSLFPSFALPTANFSSFRVGLYQVLALLFVAVSLPALRMHVTGILKDRLTGVPLILIILSVFIGLVNALDVSRGLLMGASILFLLLVLLSGYVLVRDLRGKLLFTPDAIMKAGIFYAIVSLVQLVIATMSSWNAGLCKGCGEGVFGFIRINGFAAEPLFWANALLPFALVSLYFFIIKRTRLSAISLMATVFAIGLTFARGAYTALAAGLAVCIIFTYVKKMQKTKILLHSVVLASGAMIVSWGTLIVAAVVQYPHAPYIAYNTFRGMAEHMSLGTVNLPVKSVVQPPSTIAPQATDNFVSEGLVEASSNERLDSAKIALKSWLFDMRTFIFGVGPGNLGPFAVNNVSESAPNNLTVYIFYILLVSELGLCGMGAFILIISTALHRSLRHGNKEATLLAAIIVAFAVQYFFFGSYINVIYIWLWIGCALAISTKLSTKKP